MEASDAVARCRVDLVRESPVKPVGKPDAGNRHVRFDERGRETGRRFGVSARARPRLYQSTVTSEENGQRQCGAGEPFFRVLLMTDCGAGKPAYQRTWV